MRVPRDDRGLPALARAPVFAAIAVVGLVLTAFSAGYGFHRDELYFRMLHPAWGYVDQPPLAPLLVRLFSDIVDQPWAIRIPATLSTMAAVLIVVLIARELGGDRGAQALCAWGFAFASLPMITGHVMSTASIDLVVWPAVTLLIMRAALREQPRWWLAAGVVVGLSTYNKLLVAVLLVSLAAGVAMVGPRRLLRSRWPVVAALVALVIAAPNLIYQATNGWPQLDMGRALADNNAGEVRVIMWPFLALMLGPPLVPIWIAGLVALARRPEWRPVRFVAAAFPVLLVLVFLMGSQFYYPAGLLAVLYAVGCVPTARWAASVGRRRLLVVAVAINAAVSLLIALPLIPVGSVGGTPVPDINVIAQDQIGWPAYVGQIAGVYDELPPADAARAVIVASNYGEAGAVDRYGPGRGLPAVYSGQNQLYFDAVPPATATVVIFVGGQVQAHQSLFASCQVMARFDDEVDVDNEEQGQPIAVCRDPQGGWNAVWPQLKHLD